MVHFTKIRPTKHYQFFHEKDVPWEKVSELLYSIKNPRKKGDIFEIEKEGYYILFSLKQETVYVINAKKTK